MILKGGLTGASVASLLALGLAVADVPGQVSGGAAPIAPSALLLVRIRVYAKVKERLERPLSEMDFEASTYDKSFSVEFVREIERGPMGERQFMIGVPLERGLMIRSWISDRMIVSIRSSQKTWGLWTRVVERRIADQ